MSAFKLHHSFVLSFSSISLFRPALLGHIVDFPVLDWSFRSLHVFDRDLVLALSWQLTMTMIDRLVCLRTQVLFPSWRIDLHRAIRSQWADLHQQTSRLLLRLTWLCRLLWFKNLHLHLKTLRVRILFVAITPSTSMSGRSSPISMITDLVSVRREPLHHHWIKILTQIF